MLVIFTNTLRIKWKCEAVLPGRDGFPWPQTWVTPESRTGRHSTATSSSPAHQSPDPTALTCHAAPPPLPAASTHHPPPHVSTWHWCVRQVTVPHTSWTHQISAATFRSFYLQTWTFELDYLQIRAIVWCKKIIYLHVYLYSISTNTILVNIYASTCKHSHSSFIVCNTHLISVSFAPAASTFMDGSVKLIGP